MISFIEIYPFIPETKKGENGLTDARAQSDCFPPLAPNTGFPLYFGIEIQGLFKDPEVAFSKTNSRRKFTAWTVLQQYLLFISVITGQF